MQKKNHIFVELYNSNNATLLCWYEVRLAKLAWLPKIVWIRLLAIKIAFIAVIVFFAAGYAMFFVVEWIVE